MGLFSRWFRPRADGAPAPDDWMEAEDNASELVLLGDEAATLMVQLDLDAAVANHQLWSQRLQAVLEGADASDAQMQPALLRDDTCCALGQWMQSTGNEQLKRYPTYHLLVRRHRYLHAQAADMATLVQAGDLGQAAQVHKVCCHAAGQVTLLLRELQRSLGH